MFHIAALSSLESHLWEAANILRGPVDSADSKTYVFPLFFKPISDLCDDEDAVDCHWGDVRKVAKNVGHTLHVALRHIEQANSHALYGTGDAQRTNKGRFSDALRQDPIQHFSQPPLGNDSAKADVLGQALAKADVLGQAHEHLIKKFADATNNEAGEFYTPASIVCHPTEVIEPYHRRILDPVCGFGGTFVSSARSVTEPKRRSAALHE